MSTGPNVVEDDELLYRKVSVRSGWWDGTTLLSEAFKPTREDVDGLSLDRARSEKHPEFRTMQEAARGRSPDGYFVATLRAGDLRKQGVRIEPDPKLPDNPGHTLLPDLTYANRKADAAIELREALSQELLISVEGPFPST